jgi:hypothetical protein
MVTRTCRGGGGGAIRLLNTDPRTRLTLF